MSTPKRGYRFGQLSFVRTATKKEPKDAGCHGNGGFWKLYCLRCRRYTIKLAGNVRSGRLTTCGCLNSRQGDGIPRYTAARHFKKSDRTIRKLIDEGKIRLLPGGGRHRALISFRDCERCFRTDP